MRVLESIKSDPFPNTSHTAMGKPFAIKTQPYRSSALLCSMRYGLTCLPFLSVSFSFHSYLMWPKKWQRLIKLKPLNGARIGESPHKKRKQSSSSPGRRSKRGHGGQAKRNCRGKRGIIKRKKKFHSEYPVHVRCSDVINFRSLWPQSECEFDKINRTKAEAHPSEHSKR